MEIEMSGGIKINVEADIKAMSKHLRWSQREVIPKASSRALNDVAAKAKTASAKSIAKGAGIKQKAFKKSIVVVKSTWGKLTAMVISDRWRANLIEYTSTRQTKRGVASTAWGKRKTYKGTFIATMKNGKRLVMARKGSARLPIKSIWGASIPKVFAEQATKQAMDQAVRSNFKKRFKHHIAFYLSKK
jgi:hypothetical protein